MMGKKKVAKSINEDDQKKIIQILLKRLADDKSHYDVESVWLIGKLAHFFHCDDILIDTPDQSKNLE